jgi:hypothetical protein
MLVLAAHLLFAPLTIVLAAALHAIGRAARWRPQWLWLPAAAGLIWALATGPAAALAGFAARPLAVTAALAAAPAGPAALARLAGLVLDPRRWVPGQLPVALLTAAIEAAAAWWAWWLRTDEWQFPGPRPGLLVAGRRYWCRATIRAGGVVTRDGACLGVDRSDGRRVAVSWLEAAAGVLVTGASWDAVSAAGLQFAHAAIRRRKPVIAIDLAGDQAVTAALAAACAAAEAPLQVLGADGPGYYEPFQAGSPARKAALVTGMIDWAETPEAGRRALAAALTDAFALAAAAPAGPRVPVLDDVAGLLVAGVLRARLARVPAYHPRRASLAGRVAASAARLEAEPAAAALVAEQLAGLRASPLGRWLRAGPAAGQPGTRISLAGVVRDRGVALFSLAAAGPDGSADMIANLVALDLAGVYADLRRGGIAGDGLAWFGRCERVGQAALASAQAALGCVFVTTSAQAAAGLAGQAGVLVLRRLADQALAARIAPRTGSRLVPASPVAAGPVTTGALPAGAMQGTLAAHALPAAAFPGQALPAEALAVAPFGAAHSPVVGAGRLCGLGDDEFVLVVGGQGGRVIASGEAVAGRVPGHRPVRPGRLARLDRAPRPGQPARAARPDLAGQPPGGVTAPAAPAGGLGPAGPGGGQPAAPSPVPPGAPAAAGRRR